MSNGWDRWAVSLQGAAPAEANEQNPGVRLRWPRAFFGVAVGEPTDQPWGMRDLTLFDPGGVLWRVA